MRAKHVRVTTLAIAAAAIGAAVLWLLIPAAPEGARNAEADVDGLAVATFAGGCFWCMEPPFDELDGVHATISGYTGGDEPHPSYEQVSSGSTGHVEAVRVYFDPEVIDYETLLVTFWHNVDPTRADGQFCDSGKQDRPAIFVHDDEQRRLAERSRTQAEEELGRPIVTEIVEAGPFERAETYHQDYYVENPIRYRYYRSACGRDRRLRELWGE